MLIYKSKLAYISIITKLLLMQKTIICFNIDLKINYD